MIKSSNISIFLLLFTSVLVFGNENGCKAYSITNAKSILLAVNIYEDSTGYALNKALKEYRTRTNSPAAIRKLSDYDSIYNNCYKTAKPKISNYLKDFKHIKIAKGWVLDFVYNKSSNTGYPILYARPINRPIMSLKQVSEENREYGKKRNINPRKSLNKMFLDKLISDGSPEGYFELAMFLMYSERFWLFWHGNYIDDQIMIDTNDIKSIQQFMSKDMAGIDKDLENAKKEALNLDLIPKVTICSESAIVEYVYFTLAGGFFKANWEISKKYPHNQIGYREQNVISCNSQGLY